MKKLIALIMVLALCFSLAACGGGAAEEEATDETVMIGVSMPTKSLQRWNQDGDNMKAMLEEAGYAVDLQYGGDNDIPTQVAQIENMITQGCKVLVIAAIDGSSLTEVLKPAKEAGIPVIAYDRLIMNSDAVSYYATFDNFQVGVMQGQYIETALDLKNQTGPFNIELFTGDPADNNATFFFSGAMSILQPYIDSGVLVVPSGQTTQAQVSTADWKSENAQTRMENLITSCGYSPKGKKLDAVMCSNDSTALGVTNALVSVGYTAEDMPIITGQDCDKANTKNMIAGLQSMSVFKDTRTLASKVVGMVDAIIKGGEPEINDTETYDNEIAYVADKITILRDGSTIETLVKGEDNIEESRIVKGMVGREITDRYPKRKSNIGEITMEVENWTVYHPLYSERKVCDNVNFNVRRGEVVGICGLMGAGRTELSMSIFGKSYGSNITGTLKINGKEVKLNSVRQAINAKLAYVTEDRKGNGLILSNPIYVNNSLAKMDKVSSRMVIDKDKEILVADEYKTKLNTKTPSVMQNVENLSGGNQQKVLLGKWMFADPEIMILDEPTRGIDVGAKYEIYLIINRLVAEGKSVVLISSELTEILGMSDRIFVMHEGRMIAEFKREEASQEVIMSCIMRENSKMENENAKS